MQTHHALSMLIAGRLPLPDGHGPLPNPATRLIIKEALKAELRNAVGRGCCEQGVKSGQDNRQGNRDQPLRTAEGAIAYTARKPPAGMNHSIPKSIPI